MRAPDYTVGRKFIKSHQITTPADDIPNPTETSFCPPKQRGLQAQRFLQKHQALIIKFSFSK